MADGRRAGWLPRLLVMDVDGTLTDGKIYVSAEGEPFKVFDAKDGLGVWMLLPQMGVTPLVITGLESAMVERRCGKLGIEEFYQGVSDKRGLLERLLAERGLGMGDVAYIGDDLNDLPCMEAVRAGGGLVGCPADAVPEVKAVAGFISERTGGNGAVRDFIDFLRG